MPWSTSIAGVAVSLNDGNNAPVAAIAEALVQLSLAGNQPLSTKKHLSATVTAAAGHAVTPAIANAIANALVFAPDGVTSTRSDVSATIKATQLHGLAQQARYLKLTFKDVGDLEVFLQLVEANNNEAFHRDRDLSSTTEYFGYYAQLSQQQNMLTDYTRTSTYQYAVNVNAVDFAGKVVCDVGCGTAILSFFAARAGAKKVYGIDASDMADYAKILVEKNGLSDVITIIKGKVEDLELPEKVDMIISEPMGMALLNERMLDSYIHSRKWLKPGGNMFPGKADLYCCAFSDEQLYQEFCARAGFWDSDSFFGVDLTSLKDPARQQSFRQPVIDAFAPELLVGKPALLEFDFLALDEQDLKEVKMTVSVTTPFPTRVHGLAFWFDVLFDGSREQVYLSTSPMSPVTHWYQTRCVFSKPILLTPDDNLVCNVVMRANDVQSYDISIERVQSTVSGASLDTYNLKEPYFRAFSNPTTFAGGSTAQQLDVAAQDSQGHGDAL